MSAAQPAQGSQAAQGPSVGGLVEQLMDEVGELMRRLRATLDQQSATASGPTVAASAGRNPPPPSTPENLERRLDREIAAGEAPPLPEFSVGMATPLRDGDARIPVPTPPEPPAPQAAPALASWPDMDAPETIETTIRRLRAMAAALENGSLSAPPGRRTA